ncbi:hypothetical protein LAZ67_17000790 [Cordylochernes scorpioides]|uniref:Transposase n=1 Tax=Cordylochernes scorpioides TaxID=51811 RepID=A0ABY6LCW4_9ARAC|nr:hypothetical protein LAZ67_17000790 [Cordylochernes scorpioides]
MLDGTKEREQRRDTDKVQEGYKNIANLPLIDSENIYLPPLHIKLGLMKNFVKAMDRNASGFAYLKQQFSSISEAMIKEGIFVGPQIRELQQDGNFQNSLNEVETAAWNSFRKVCKIFLGSVKVENYRDIVNDLLLSYKALGCNMSLKIHFLHSHLDFFPDNLGAVSDEHGERFHQDISSMEKRYQALINVGLRSTISRRLVANGLHSCRPLRRLPLTPPNRRQRLEWCRARSTWMTEWHRVVFSDESRFCLSSDSRRVRVWRRRGERSNPAAIVERPTVRQRGIMVWGAIAYDSRSPLLCIQGTMTAQRYVDDVLRPVTLPYLQGVPNALYQQDNARPHNARISQQALQDVQMLPWPPYSPDLSPIEHVWDIIGRHLHALPQPRSEDELWQMVEREWRAIPQDAIRTLIDSLPRRVAACIAVRGGPTCY